MRNFIDIITESETTISDDIKEKILSDYRVARGLKLSDKTQLWRGESEESGSGMNTLGMGLYFTADKKYAAQFGKVVPISRTYLPDNPLRFKTNNDYEIWLQTAQRLLGYPSNREFVEDYNDIGEFVRSLDPTIDGIQIYTGRDAIFVLYDDSYWD